MPIKDVAWKLAMDSWGVRARLGVGEGLGGRQEPEKGQREERGSEAGPWSGMPKKEGVTGQESTWMLPQPLAPLEGSEVRTSKGLLSFNPLGPAWHLGLELAWVSGHHIWGRSESQSRGKSEPCGSPVAGW